MRLINADNLDCETLPKKLYPHLQAILDFIDSQPTVEERKEEKWIPENIPYDNVQEKVVTQREVICGLNAMNDELQAKLDKIEQIVNKWNNDASHSFEDMCKINGILKE